MSKSIDERVVQMKFENHDFERNAKASLSTLDKLKEKLKFKNATSGLEEISSAAGKVNMSALGGAVDAVQTKFSALQIFATTALADISLKAVHAGEQLVKSLTIDPIKMGFQEYNTQLSSSMVIKANTGKDISEINKTLDELNRYADKTIYNFTQMTSNLGKFTAAGVDLEKSSAAIKGLGNLAAISGASAEDMSRATYQLSQALAAGTIKLMDWNSVVNANMGNTNFQNSLKRTAKVHGIAVDDMIKKQGSFRETLSEGWLTTDIFIETMRQYAGEMTEAEMKTAGYTDEMIADIKKLSKTAEDAATKPRTWSQLWDATMESVQSGWTTVFRTIIGDLDQATDLWGKVNDFLNGEHGIISGYSNFLTNVFETWSAMHGREVLMSSFGEIYDELSKVSKFIRSAYESIFPKKNLGVNLYDSTKAFHRFATSLHFGTEELINIKRTFQGLFSVVKVFTTTFRGIGKVFKTAISSLTGLDGSIFSITGALGRFVSETIDAYDICGKIERFFDSISSKKFKLPSFEGVGEAIYKSLSWVADTIALIFNNAGKAIDKVRDAISTFINWIKTSFAGPLNTLKESLTFDNITHVFQSGGILAIIAYVLKSVKSISGLTDNIKDGIEGIFDKGLFKTLFGSGGDAVEKAPGIIDSLKDSLKSFQQSLRANVLLKIAAALFVLAKGVETLSTIDPDSMTYALTSLTIMFGELFGMMAGLSFLMGKKSFKGINDIASAMLLMSGAVLVLSKAMKTLADIDGSSLISSLIAITVLLAELSGVAYLFGKNKDMRQNFKKTAESLVIMSAAVLILSKAVASLGGLSIEELAKGVTALGVILAELAGFSALVGKFEAVKLSSAVGFIATAAAIAILANVVKQFGKMNIEEIQNGLLALAAVLVELSVSLSILGEAKNVTKSAAALFIVAAALLLLTPALKILSGMSLEEIGKSLLVLAGALGIMVAALHLMPKDMPGIAAGMLAIAVAMDLLLIPLLAFSRMSLGGIAKSLLVFAGVMGVLAISVKLMADVSILMPAIGIGLITMAAGIDLLAVALIALSTVGLEGIITGLVGLVGIIVTVGGAALILGTMLPLLLAAAGGIAAFSLSVVLFGAACAAVGAGLTVLSVGIIALVTAIKTVIEGFVAFCNGLGAIVDYALAPVTNVISSVKDKIKGIFKKDKEVETDAKGFGRSISDNVAKGADEGKSAVENSGKALGNAGKAGLDSTLDLFKGSGEMNGGAFATALGSMTGDTSSAGALLGNSGATATDASALFEQFGISDGGAFAKSLKSKEGDAKSAGGAVAKAGADGADSKKDKFESGGKHAGDGFIKGLNSKLDAAKTAAKNFASNAWEALKGFLSISSPSKLFGYGGEMSGEGYIGGLEKTRDKSAKAAERLGETTYNSLTDALTGMWDLLSGEYDFQPTITPVVDVSEAAKSAKYINGIFGDTEAKLNGISTNSIRSDAFQIIQSNNSDMASVIEAITAVRSDIYNLNLAMAQMQVVLDTGAMVGGMYSKMDNKLGQVQGYKGRNI